MNEFTHTDQSQFDQHVLELLNGSIDGELSVAEQAELDELLAGSADVRNLHQELHAMTGILAAVPERGPPGYLHDAITSQVRLPAPAGGQEGEFRRFSGLLSTSWMRNGLAVAAGLLLTVGIYQTGSKDLSPGDTANMTGTVVKHPAGTLLDSTRFDAEVMTGEVELRSRDGLLSVAVLLDADGITDFKLGYSGLGLEYAGVSGLDNPADDVAVANGSVRVTGSGQQHFELLLRRSIEIPEGSVMPLALEIFADNVLIHKAELGGSK